jgi:UDP-N-acetylglucosamine--N-acetylmuramyl-(pentapeptide) pyrophosphoryl-undecaprenol N-acetylglucosamine transferase
VAYEGLARFFPQEKILLTGNPIRKDLLQPLPERTEALQSLGLGDRPTLLILGGSLGAKRINVAVEAHYQSWLAQGYNVIWQTGRLYFEALKQRIPATDGLWMNAFIAEMPKAMAAADLVLSRAGAGTLSELEVLGKASLLVPSPNVAEDHQTHNARALAEDGAAVMIAENDLENELAEAIQQLMEDHGRRQKIAEAALRRGRPLATEQIVDAIETLIRKA